MREKGTFPFLLAAVLAVAARAEVNWGADFANGTADPLLAEVWPELVAVLQAGEAERPGLIDQLIARRAASHIEALKRVRSPELQPLFVKLLDHEEWRLRHRALYVLEGYGDASVLPRAWAMLDHEQPRMRERAAIFCIKMWSAAAAKDIAGPAARLQELRGREEHLHVRRCLELLGERIAGKHTPERVHEEHVRAAPDGLKVVPIIDGFDKIAARAPGYVAKANSRAGGKSAAKLAVATRWTTPILLWGTEEARGASLQPFANPREGGRVHTGQDLGASLEGCGFYACADGVVRFVHTGSDMGTLIVVEHHVAEGKLVNSVYMHGGNTVFVGSGDEVKVGQLLTTEGLGFSIENGGHYAHLHHGLYPGDFQVTHNYGYKMAADGLADWLDPAVMIPRWMEQTAPIVPDLRAVAGELDKVAAQVGKGSYGKAYAQLVKLEEKLEGEAAADALYVKGLLEAAPAQLQERATRQRDAGYPSAALELLEGGTQSLEGIPGADAVAESAKAWPKDDAFKKALKGEAELTATLARIAQLKKKEQEQARPLLEAVRGRYGDTVLKERIDAELEALPR